MVQSSEMVSHLEDLDINHSNMGGQKSSWIDHFLGAPNSSPPGPGDQEAHMLDSNI